MASKCLLLGSSYVAWLPRMLTRKESEEEEFELSGRTPSMGLNNIFNVSHSNVGNCLSRTASGTMGTPHCQCLQL